MYDFGSVHVPATPAVLAAVAAEHPERAAVIAEDGELTYAELAARAARIAAGLTALGLRPHARVGVLLPNGVRWCAATLGAHAAGLCVVPLNSWFKPAELEAVVRRAGVGVVIAQEEIFGQDQRQALAGICSRLDVRALWWPAGTPLPQELPEVPVADPVRALHDSPATGDHDALLLFTSGSTAEPKAVRLLQRGIITNAHAVGERQGIRAGDRFWLSLPLFFVFGCANALPNALTHAATLCLQERFEPASALEFLERHRCTVYYGVAPVTRALAACEDLPRRDISALRTGTSNATAEDLRITIEVLGVTEVCNAYGMTEGYGHTAITDHRDPPHVRMTSQGTPLPTQELRLVGPDGAAVAVGEQGAIQIRGTVTPGYLDDDALNGTAFDPEGWFSTGDLATLDADGRLHFVGRSHEMMKVKGINISPAEVEAQLVAHEAVDECFVFGIPTDEGDQRVGAVVVSTTSDPDGLAGDVVRWARERMSTYKVPTRIWVLTADRLPLTATGKVSKRLLQEQVLQ